MTYVLFDIGAQKTRVTISTDLETVGKVASFNTPNKLEEGVEKIIEAVGKLTKDKPVAMAGGIRGLLNEEKTGIENDAILNLWINKSLVAELQEKYDVPVYLENDTAIAGLGEAVFGAAKELDSVAYHTIDIGVGGTRIVNQELDAASAGFEPGHQVLDIDRTVLGDAIDPTLENLVSETAVAERFGMKVSDIPQNDVVWDELAEYVAQGLRNTVLYWSPEVIVLGGSMINGEPAISVEKIRRYTVDTLAGFIDCPLIMKSTLGDQATFYGAMALIKNQE